MPSWKRIPTVSDKLSVFAATSSSELAGVLSDETGSGSVVFSASPTFTGSPLAPTASASDGSTKLATTAYVDNQASLGDTSLASTKIWIGTSGGAKAEFPLSGDATMTAGGAVTVVGGTTDLATSITAVANNSTNETVYPTFVDGATGTQGLETDTGLTYNPSSGVMTGTRWTGAVTGNVTGNASGSSGTCTGLAGSATILASARTIGGVSFNGSANIDLPGVNETGDQDTSGSATTVTTAAQSAITSLGTLTTLTVDNVIINGTTIGHTGDTDLMTVASGTLTVSGAVAAHSLDISGDADIDGTLETDALTIGGTAIGSIYGAVAGSSSVVTVGALNSGSITSGFGTIDTGSSSITTTGVIYAGGLTVDGEITASGGTVTLTGEVAINDQVVILNADASSNAVNNQDVGFEVERGSSNNSGIKWMETGHQQALSRWEVIMINSADDAAFSIPLAVMSDNTNKEAARKGTGDGCFYQASGALYCYL